MSEHHKKGRHGTRKEKDDDYVIALPLNGTTFMDMDHPFHALKNKKTGKFYFLAKEIIEDGLEMIGYRLVMDEISDKDKILKTLGNGNKKLWISERGILTLFLMNWPDNMIRLKMHLNRQYVSTTRSRPLEQTTRLDEELEALPELLQSIGNDITRIKKKIAASNKCKKKDGQFPNKRRRI